MITTTPRIVKALPAGGRRIELTFSDASTRTVDVGPLLRGPVFERIASDGAAFAELYVDEELGTVCWPGELDLAPEALAALPAASGATPRTEFSGG